MKRSFEWNLYLWNITCILFLIYILQLNGINVIASELNVIINRKYKNA